LWGGKENDSEGGEKEVFPFWGRGGSICVLKGVDFLVMNYQVQKRKLPGKNHARGTSCSGQVGEGGPLLFSQRKKGKREGKVFHLCRKWHQSARKERVAGQGKVLNGRTDAFPSDRGREESSLTPTGSNNKKGGKGGGYVRSAIKKKRIARLKWGKKKFE